MFPPKTTSKVLHKSVYICRKFILLPITLLMAMPVDAAEQGTAASVTEPVLDLTRTTSLAMTLFKVLGSLVLVIGLLAILAFWLKKLGLARTSLRQGSLISVLDTKMIAPKKYIAVVQVADETLALGITDQQITMLTNLDGKNLPDMSTTKSPKTPPAFSALLNKAANRSDT
ncbi:MAG: flagellar biosynthetic protein FliO [Desulfobulbaceae bacterium]|nr:flagellar biosynthetic protein FliO [Desulfobulbaceae bacterium]